MSWDNTARVDRTGDIVPRLLRRGSRHDERQPSRPVRIEPHRYTPILSGDAADRVFDVRGTAGGLGHHLQHPALDTLGQGNGAFEFGTDASALDEQFGR